jgi:hypothetical protein
MIITFLIGVITAEDIVETVFVKQVKIVQDVIRIAVV